MESLCQVQALIQHAHFLMSQDYHGRPKISEVHAWD